MRDLTRTATIAIAALGLALAAFQLSRPGMLLGATPDVSVYLAASVRLLEGALPYRDYVFVQPPGIALLLAPFAALAKLTGTRLALAALRLALALAAPAAVLLVGRLLRGRGTAAVLAGCGVTAAFPAFVYALDGPPLEPIAVLLVLGAAALGLEGDASTRRLAVAGVLLGLALNVKITAALPAFALVVSIAAVDLRWVRPLLLGAIGGIAALAATFLALAPGEFLDDVVAVQLQRVDLPAAALGLAVVAVLLVAAARRGLPALDLFAAGATLLVGVALLVPKQHYPQYAALLGPFLALLVGVAAGRLEAVRGLDRAAPAAAAAAIALLAVWEVAAITGRSANDLAAAVDALVPVGACAFSDSPRDLVTTDRLPPAGRSCPLEVDPYGTYLARGDAASWRQTLSRADYLVTETPFESWYLRPDSRLRALVASEFRVVRSGPVLVYVRRAR